MSLDSIPITELKGVGKSLADVLTKLHIHSVQDLVFHLPIRYLDRTKITAIGSIKLNQYEVIQGRIIKNQVGFGKKRSLEIQVEDDSGWVTLRFYHFSAAQKNNLELGKILRCFGEPRLGRSGIEFYHPEYEFVEDTDIQTLDATLTPIYGLTEGISQQRLRKLTQLAISYIDEHPPQELLPPSITNIFKVESLAKSLAFIHFPPPNAAIEKLMRGQHDCQKRLAFEELLAHFLVKQRNKARLHLEDAPNIQENENQTSQFLNQLSFSPTRAQLRVYHEIISDLKLGKPMLRMVQGDVGSGKTLVAALAALACVSSNYQVALVAPTEILAEQHLANFKRWFEPLGYIVTWLVGKLTPKQKEQTLKGIHQHDSHIVIGTHALFQDSVSIPKLGLAIIDEQHRFGVTQRLSLKKKSDTGETPHQLIMTATPIPRTLAMTAYADLDYSVIDELPPGRKPVSTRIISQSRRTEIIERIHHAGKKGKQIYWVCPLVEESETLSVTNAEETAETLSNLMPDLRIGLVHGRMKSKEKERVMDEFKSGTTQILVATTVIEVGVDVPNASFMIIENPERLGLAQLHQLRGRVGRGTEESHCILLYGNPLSNHAKERLKVLRESNNGFVIAERDLEIRGPGDLFGTRQTGEMRFRIADPVRDASLINLVHEKGSQLTTQSPEIVKQLIDRWFKHSEIYAQV